MSTLRTTLCLQSRPQVVWAFFSQLMTLFGYGVLMMVAAVVTAQEEATEEVTTTAIYVPLKPPFVVNYGGRGRLKYFKAEISVRVDNHHMAGSIRHHMPFIRNNLVLLFSRQSDDDLDTSEGKEMLRLAALEEVRKVIESEEEASDGVVDLYFNNFIVQK